MSSDNLIKSVVATAEVMGTELSIDGARMMCAELAEFSEPMVLAALSRCRRELRSKLTLADIIQRLDDGRPGPDEAWSMMPRDEKQTVVWTEEMASAMRAAQPLLDAGDQVAARMAFRDAYQREISSARAQKKTVRWMASLGWDARGREAALREAVEKGRIDVKEAAALLPSGEFTESFPTLPRSDSMKTIQSLIPEKLTKEKTP